METKLDLDQLKAVGAEKNTVVTAGAGSGKTTVLAHRFVHLLRPGGAEVDGIPTLTSTRKAAAEMYERIYRLLLEQGESVPSEDERGRLRAALKGFEKAAISTLDSFCAGIVRGGSSRFGVPGDFRQDEYAGASLIEENALQFLLEKSTDPPMGHFFKEHGVESVLNRLLVPLAKEEFHMAAEIPFEEMFDRQLNFLRSRLEESAVKLGEVRRWFLEEDLPTDKNSLMNPREALRRIGDPLDALEAKDWSSLAKTGATKLRSPGQAKNPIILEGKERIKIWKEETARLLPIVALFQNEEIYRGMYRLLAEYQRRIADMKRSNGILTFRDVVEMAVTLLREEPELRSYYKGRFTHIMIDEFQDNNDLQRRLLFLLAEREDLNTPGIPSPDQLKPDKLFFVGDEKQSIYRFRGADVRVLKQLQKQIRESGGETLQLPRNYRSHSGVIAFFNRLFKAVMGEVADAQADFEAEFEPLEAPEAHTGFAPAIQLLYQPYRLGAEDEDDSDSEPGEEVFLSTAEAEAWAVVKFIKERIGTGGLKVRDGKDEKGNARTRPAVYDDVAILMRSSSKQIHLEKFLRRLQIPYTVQSIRSLFQDAPVNDIYQMLQLLVYPEDYTAYAALLRSPFVHLADDMVGRIILETRDRRGEAFSHGGEEDFFTDPGEREKYLQAKRLYYELRDAAVDQPVTELIRHLWYEGGYRYVVLRDPDYHLYLEFYDALTALARLSDSRGLNLALFLDFLRKNLGDYKKMEDLELLPRSSRGVQLLSIHKSKGLEFPVVILADTGNTGGGGQKPLFFRDDEFGLVFDIHEKSGNGKKTGRNYFSEAARDRQKREEAAELKRLLYVGCTRAEDHLVIAGSHHSRNRKMDNEEGQKALLNLVLEAFGWDGESPVPDMGSPLGCDIHEVPEATADEVHRRSLRSKSRPMEQVTRLMGESSLIRREVPQREWNATELNLLSRERESDGVEEAAGGEPGGEPVGEPEGEPEGVPGDVPGATTHGNMNPIYTPSTVQHIPVNSANTSSAPRKTPVNSRLPILKELDPLLKGSAAAMAFGDLVHETIEYEVKGLPGKPGLPTAFLDLEPVSVQLLEDGARTVADRFFATPLGEEVRVAARAGLVESELPFLLRIGIDRAESQNLVRGQIDLLLQRENEVVVVDFKTDREVRPEGYAVQMAVYREAAAELYGRPARSILVYVRSGELHEVDTKVDLNSLLEVAKNC